VAGGRENLTQFDLYVVFTVIYDCSMETSQSEAGKPAEVPKRFSLRGIFRRPEKQGPTVIETTPDKIRQMPKVSEGGSTSESLIPRLTYQENPDIGTLADYLLALVQRQTGIELTPESIPHFRRLRHPTRQEHRRPSVMGEKGSFWEAFDRKFNEPIKQPLATTPDGWSLEARIVDSNHPNIPTNVVANAIDIRVSNPSREELHRRNQNSVTSVMEVPTHSLHIVQRLPDAPPWTKSSISMRINTPDVRMGVSPDPTKEGKVKFSTKTGEKITTKVNPGIIAHHLGTFIDGLPSQGWQVNQS
jgi:hypothetical protein